MVRNLMKDSPTDLATDLFRRMAARQNGVPEDTDTIGHGEMVVTCSLGERDPLVESQQAACSPHPDTPKLFVRGVVLNNHFDVLHRGSELLRQILQRFFHQGVKLFSFHFSPPDTHSVPGSNHAETCQRPNLQSTPAFDGCQS